MIIEFAANICLEYALCTQIVDRTQTESPYFHIQALGSMGYHFCYLGTAQMNILCVPLVWFGNSSCMYMSNINIRLTMRNSFDLTKIMY